MINLTRRNFIEGAAAAGMLGALAGCSGGTSSDGGSDAGSAASSDTPLVVGYSNFSSKFSPFFSETAYDQDAYAMTQVSLINNDRLGQIIYKGIDGETTEYNGTEYTYYGPADVEVTENEDGTVIYDITMRDDIVDSEGENLTADDIIFNYYVLCDPTYDGSSTLFSFPIKGMEAYRSGMASLFSLINEAGRDNTDFTYWTEEQQTAFWAGADECAANLAQEIVDYCVAAGYNEEGDIAGAAANWGFEGVTDIDSFAQALLAGYEDDIATMVSTESAGSGIADLFPDYDQYLIGVETGDSADHIEGIEKTGDYSVRVTTDSIDATLIYNLGVSLAPLHYYGDTSQYDYDNNKFGFPKGDLSVVRSKTTQPMGAGPYKFIKYENGVINYEANDSYYLGAPKTKYINFREMSDEDKLNGVVTGTVDITDPSYSKDTVTAIEQSNSNGEVTGDVITTDTVDNLGYGYVGMNSHNVCVGDDPASDASKNFRKGLATILAVYRDVAVDSYYSTAAEVINYPISNTSWAAPQPTDEGYKVAFSVDVDGNDIYTSDMSSDDKIAAAKEAALGFFEAAGFTVEGGKVTAAPDGAKLEYEAMVPADGTGNHPAFMLLTEAHNALEELGINLIVTDLTNSADLWTKLEANQGEIWAAAWGATIDPDMYQVYYSDVAHDGAEPGGSNYMYQIEDEELDELIMDARSSTDQDYRKQIYKACLDIVVDWACEIPFYQRQNAIIFSTERVNIDSVTPDISTFYGWMNEIEKIALN